MNTEDTLNNHGCYWSRNEPLLRAAIDDIIGVAAKVKVSQRHFQYEKVTDYRCTAKVLNGLHRYKI